MPVTHPFGQKYDTTHTLNCKKGVTIKHNNIGDYEANLLAKIHTVVETGGPSLQLIEGEIVNGIPDGNVRPDVRVRGVWRDGENALSFFS